MSEMFQATGERLAWQNNGRWHYAPLCSAAADAVRWDGAAPETTGAVHIEAHDLHAYVEVKVTGRAPRTLAGGIFGTKARVRFTGQDDSGEWLDAIVYKVK